MQHAVTLLARSPASLIEHLARLPARPAASPLLWTLSTHPSLSQSNLGTLTQTLRRLAPSSIGCLTAPVPSAHSASIACSLAFFDRAKAAVFRSAIPGRAEVQVGRLPGARRTEQHAPGKLEMDTRVAWEDVWSGGAAAHALPPELESLRESGVDVHTIAFFTDNAPQGLMGALGAFPRAAKLGLIASSTPFVTGRPYTLVHGSAIHSAGAVGLALFADPRPEVATAFPGLAALTGNLTVTRSEGNLVQELDGANPSRLLLSAIQGSGIEAKEHEFYVGVRAGNETVQVHHILSGDPGRGTIALESEVAPAAETVIQLMHGARHGTQTLPLELARSKQMSFISTARDELPSESVQADGGDDVQVLEGVFLAASENGFLLGRGTAEQTWTCTTPGAVASLVWPGA